MSFPTRVRMLPSEELTPSEIGGLRRLLWAAFADDDHGAFSEDDWQHALGGMHFVLEMGGDVVAHAAVVERELNLGVRPVRTGYVEAVATSPDHQRRGLGTTLMRKVNSHIDQSFELGAPGTGSHGFYERLGWRLWRGPSHVRTPTGLKPTPDEDGYIMVLPTRASPPLDLDAPISCEWRPGDVW